MVNVWKVSTIVFAGALALVVGNGASMRAQAASSASAPAAIGFEWGREQPHMERALDDLRGARHSLQAAAEHKGGWRVLALRHTDEAIAETVRGIEYARNHPHD